MTMNVKSLHIGLPTEALHRGKPVMTGIFKRPVTGPVRLTATGFEGDGQADLIHHGGPDKAVCVYAAERYPYWNDSLGGVWTDGSFGENMTVEGLPEEQVCVGDTFAVGTAVVQISQPRQPCFKLAMRYELPDLPLLVQQTGYTGYYFRVLQEGVVSAGDAMKLLKPHPAQMTVAAANLIMHIDKENETAIRRLLQVNELSASWRTTLLKRL